MVARGRIVIEDYTVDMSDDEQDQLADLLVGLKLNLLEAGFGPQLTIVDGSKKVS
jgi:hypothetical protein